MNQGRRHALKRGGSLALFSALAAAGLIKPQRSVAAEWNKAAFEQKTLEEAFKALGASGATENNEVLINAPDIAENGAVVPINVVSNLGKTQSIAILIEKNPNMLAANFTLPMRMLPDVQTRVKMAQTSNVFALVKADGKFYFARKEIKITLGGCGG